MRRFSNALLLLTDVGFLAYWALVFAHAVPTSWLFRAYDHPLVAAWNWSFLPIDLLVSATGLGSLALRRTCPRAAESLLLLSLAMTSLSGLQGVLFFLLRGDVTWSWLLPNAFLFVWPLAPLFALMWTQDNAPSPASEPPYSGLEIH